MVNMKTDTSKKVSLYGNFKLKDESNIKTIGIEYENICDVIESFYTTLNKANIKLSDVNQINLCKMIMNNKSIDCNNKGFWIAGYAKKRDADEKSMRNYFNIKNPKLDKLFEEFIIFYKNHLKYYFESIKEIQVIVEGFKII